MIITSKLSVNWKPLSPLINRIVTTPYIATGLIQRFDFITELAWKSLKDYLEDQGLSISMASPRAVLKEAYASGIVDDETVWNEILQARNLTSHIYDEKTAITIADQICHHFMAAFRKLKSFYKNRGVKL